MRRLLLGLLLAGCAGSRGAAAIPPPSSPPDACAGRTGLVLELPVLVPAWDGGAATGGSAPGVLRWCGPGELALGTAQLTWPDGGSQTWERELVLTHGQTHSLVLIGRVEPSTGTLEVRGMSGGAPVVARGVVRSVQSPVEVEARAACSARGGSYGPHGMMGVPSCDAPTRDGGSVCRSNAECEVACVADDGATILEGGSCLPGQERFEHRGRCFERTLFFGCHAILPDPVVGCRGVGEVTFVAPVRCVD